MNLGCLEDCMFSSDKQSAKIVVDSHYKEGEATDDSLASSSSRIGKNKSSKETSPSSLNALNKFTSQIKKPPHRKNSPLNWFPRKKIDSYLKRKIKMLQEVDGMNLTLDETLEDSNPHYCRVLREKMAAKEAAHKAIEARKAALVEASWSRILQAARIRSQEADEVLLKAEKAAAEAFESATALGVIMYDIPNCPKSTCQVEASTISKAGSTTHTVRASFETAFEVDKQVAAAVKTAFLRLASCPSFDKDEFKDLLRKINENPDTGDSNLESTEFSSECQSSSEAAASELEILSQKDGFKSEDFDRKISASETKQKRKAKRRQSLEKCNPEKLVEVMFERLKCLQEDELSSLATIVATCGLNAALAEVEYTKLENTSSIADHPSASALNFTRRPSSIGAGTVRKTNQTGQVDSELPSMDKFLVKHMTKLEREVLEARSKRSVSKDESCTLVKQSSNSEEEIQENKSEENSGMDHKKSDENTSVEAVPDLGSILVKHSSKLEKEILEAKRNHGNTYELNGKKRGVMSNGGPHKQGDTSELPSLDKFLVKHVSRLEREVEEAKSRRNKEEFNKEGKVADGEVIEKENINLNKEVTTTESEDSLDKILVKPVSRLEREKMQALSSESNYGKPRNQKKQGGIHVTDCESLDKVLVKHVSRLEKEKLRSNANEEMVKVNREGVNMQPVDDQGSLDQILVKHKSRLEKEKMAAIAEQPSEQIRFSVSRREAREKELQEAWGGLSLANSIRAPVDDQGSLDQILVKHKSKLEKEKMATTEQPSEQIKLSVSRRERRDREMQEAWGGLSLGNSIKPHFSRLERDKAAWRKAEEEERMQSVME